MDHRAVPGRMADMPPGAQGANPYVRPAMQRHTSGLRLVSEDRERIVRKDQMCVKCGKAITGQFVRALSGVYPSRLFYLCGLRSQCRVQVFFSHARHGVGCGWW